MKTRYRTDNSLQQERPPTSKGCWAREFELVSAFGKARNGDAGARRKPCGEHAATLRLYRVGERAAREGGAGEITSLKRNMNVTEGLTLPPG